jgi:hypothetical protein
LKTNRALSEPGTVRRQWIGILAGFCLLPSAFAFEGRIAATLTRGANAEMYLYTVGTNQLRIERVETNWPYPWNLVDRDSGAVTLLFPHNRSFVRLKNPEPDGPPVPGAPGMPLPNGSLPQGIGPQSAPGSPASGPAPMPPPPGVGLAGFRSPMPSPPAMPSMPPGVGPQPGGAGGMPPMPVMPPMPADRAELKAMDQTTNLLGYTCTRYEFRLRGEVMEIWATDRLMAFQPYLPNQPHRFGPKMMEEQWGDLLKAKKLFPLLVILKFENGPERMRFEVKSVTPEKIKKEQAEQLFRPPPEYQEIQPLPF